MTHEYIDKAEIERVPLKYSDKVIGTAVIFEDGTIQAIVDRDLAPEIYSCINTNIFNYVSIKEES